MRNFSYCLAGVFLLVLSGCGFLESVLESPGASSSVEIPTTPEIQGVDPGAGLPLQTLHFRVEGYGNIPHEKGAVAEKIYTTVMDKTSLYSFRPENPYRLVIYRTKEEFQEKTNQPAWSGGMESGRRIFTYEQGNVDAVLAHEITHLIFREFVGEETKDQRWLNEGLAMFIDAHFHATKTFDAVESEWLKRVRKSPILSMEEILAFKVYSEKGRAVGKWYNTVASLVGFLIENGGSFNFSLFLGELKKGGEVEEALAAAYPGKFRSLEELHTLWKLNYGLR